MYTLKVHALTLSGVVEAHMIVQTVTNFEWFSRG